MNILKQQQWQIVFLFWRTLFIVGSGSIICALNFMPPTEFENQLKGILSQYRQSFTDKNYNAENEAHDVLMDVFGITPLLKRENRQYWGRELGMCWQRLVCEIFSLTCNDYKPAMRIEADEPCDCVVGSDVIDTKYRIGSGDSGTLKKFKQYGKMFQEQGLRPMLLILREDNLPAAIGACKVGGWDVLTGTSTFNYLKTKSGFDLNAWLRSLAETKEFFVAR
ncbi:MAG TPA: hypothetical protein VMF08_20725 [Candidatus Sulfotelmatobacter sp.]|nr:hypothetical protein [Candidatus Sulfotelmatobacter sp.]